MKTTSKSVSVLEGEKTTDDLKLVYVEWEDSCGAQARWQYLSESGSSRVLCRSVGWLVYDGKDCKRIVPHIAYHADDSERSEQGCGDMTIPTSAVLTLKTISL